MVSHGVAGIDNRVIDRRDSPRPVGSAVVASEILAEPEDQEYGDRRYTARDLEGHHWFFAQQVRQVDPEEWGATVSR